MQRWFGATISKPLLEPSVEAEAARYIAPSPTLKPVERIELYHKQYWWRLLRTLQENFPTLTFVYGHTAFNQQIATPYLTENPPTHWALCQLGQTLPNWLIENNFSDLERDLAQIEAAAQRAFWVGEREGVAFEALTQEEIVTRTLELQPHVHLFELGGDLFTFRDVVLSEERAPDVRQGKCYFALYRNLKNQVRWKELSIGEYALLVQFKRGASIEEACAALEAEGDASYEEAQELLPLWSREWTFLRWFA